MMLNKGYYSADEHIEELAAEVERLKQENERLQNLHNAAMVLQGKIISKNEKLKEALRKCSPIEMYWNDDSAESEEIDRCMFCDTYEKTGLHAPDCEYMRLCK